MMQTWIISSKIALVHEIYVPCSMFQVLRWPTEAQDQELSRSPVPSCCVQDSGEYGDMGYVP